MGLTKYTQTESHRIVSEAGHKEIEENLHRIGKTSARDLTAEERKQTLEKPK
jgi:hypothetical protein